MPLHRLSLKLALAVGAVAALVLAGAVVAGAAALWVAVVGSLLVAGAGYAAGHRLLAGRLRLADTTLRQIRRREFENLEAAHLPQGDELNGLVWQVYRTGLVVEKEIKGMQQLESYRREYLGNVSHELKTPIFAIQGFAETLLEGGLEDERYRRSFVEKILRNASRLAHLVQDLTEISRIETGQLKMTIEAFDVAPLAAEVAESLELAAKAKQVELRQEIPAGLPPARGDRERIRQVLVNLVDNAIKYNKAGGHVVLRVRQEPDGELRFAVVDDGIGLSPQEIPRVTERFYRVDKSRARYQGGTGLGLAIVKHILAAHERQLTIESTLGSGSTFGFTLPAASR